MQKSLVFDYETFFTVNFRLRNSFSNIFLITASIERQLRDFWWFYVLTCTLETPFFLPNTNHAFHFLQPLFQKRISTELESNPINHCKRISIFQSFPVGFKALSFLIWVQFSTVIGEF